MASDFANDNCLFCPNAATKTGFFSGYIFRNESIKARIFWGLCATSNMTLTPSTLCFSNRPGIVICTDFFRASFGRGGFLSSASSFSTAWYANVQFRCWKSGSIFRKSSIIGEVIENCECCDSARCRIIVSISEACRFITTESLWWIIPAFSWAISVRVLPNNSVWSSPISVMTRTVGERKITLVVSSRPPIPTSIMI